MVADRQRSGKCRCRFQLPAVRRRYKQGPRRCVRQSCHPRDLACRAFDGRIPAEGEPGSREQALASEVERRIALLRGWHESLEFRRAAAETRALWVLANGYIQEQAPWATIKSDPARAAVTTRSALNLLTLCAVVGWSIIPTFANRVLAAFGEKEGCPSWPAHPVLTLLDARKGQPISRIEPLVGKLTETEISHLQSRFSGAEG